MDRSEFDLFIASGDGNQFPGTGAYMMDVNGEGSDGIIVGDMGFHAMGREDAGKVYVFFGARQSGIGLMDGGAEGR